MLKVINGGIEILVEDWPGRLGYMGLGMAAAGAMDNLALQLGNLLVGNDPGEAGLEIAGGYCEFEIMDDGVIAITGADMEPELNGVKVPIWETIEVKAGDRLKFSHFGQAGFRSYITISGGIDVPEYLGSKSTCLFGSYGGFKGRKLEKGDEIPAGKANGHPAHRKINPKYIPHYDNIWELRTIPGPEFSAGLCNGKGMDYLFNTEMKISHNANRAAYRLEEVPDYFWARSDGGKGGSHPSNIVDHGYNMRGAVNVTGNTPSLIADGPTLGGFVCVANVINADLWKIGQGIPARDKVKLKLVTVEEGIEARKRTPRNVNRSGFDYRLMKEGITMEYTLKAHMPGLVARVVCEVGDKVEEGQELAVINCMKTEMSCVTEKAGTVKEILVAEWDEMDIGTPMIILDV